MKKILLNEILDDSMPSSVGYSSQKEENNTSESQALIKIKGEYTAYIGGYDLGCAVDKIILKLNYEIDKVTKDTFVITETKQVPNALPFVEGTFARKVTNAYVSDEFGNKVNKASKYITIEMYVGLNDGSPLVFSTNTMRNTYSQFYHLDIKLNKGEILTSNTVKISSFEINKEMTKKVTDADPFEINSFAASDGVVYSYASYVPESESKNLVVWLHGLGEGGVKDTDPHISVLANKVTSLISDEFQEIIGGAYVLVPQCPTFWMDSTGKGLLESLKTADGTSYYQKSLHELIDFYKNEHKIENIILAGCSNGGYMSLLMALNYQTEYNAYVMICEAIPDKFITNEQLESIKDLALYFIYSKDDTTVIPEEHSIPTIERLQNMNASNLHVFSSEAVVDTSGKYKDKNGNPYIYDGHFSWIYFFNNKANCNDCDFSVWQWMAKQIK